MPLTLFESTTGRAINECPAQIQYHLFKLLNWEFDRHMTNSSKYMGVTNEN